MNPDQYAKANATIARLVELYPRTFFLLGRHRSPLKIGISDDLIAAGVAEPDELERALGLYCRSFGYRRAMRVGAARLNLAGGAEGTVSVEHASTAEELDKRRAAYRARKAEAEHRAAEEAHKRYIDAWSTMDKLSALYPLAFFVKGRNRRRPLKRDIVKDIIVDAGANVLVETDVENALRFYMGSKDYLKGVKEGVERISLAGEPTGVLVTADEAAAAASYLAIVERRREERKAAAQPITLPTVEMTAVQPIAVAVQPAVKTIAPQPISETAQPKRRLLGLADLKAAAMARRQLESAT